MVAASERAHKITKADLRELKQLENPPAGVDSVVFAALGLVGKGCSKWDTARANVAGVYDLVQV
jgi:hypothetical protein